MTIPRAALAGLAATDGVAVVSADLPVHVQGGADRAGSLALQAANAPARGAAEATGRGVTVALVDTGIADVPDLAGRVVPVERDVLGRTSPCKDLSGQGKCVDAYGHGHGHGTFMAGLIDGNGAGGQRTGAAPDARLVSVKVAGADGAADVSTEPGGTQERREPGNRVTGGESAALRDGLTQVGACRPHLHGAGYRWDCDAGQARIERLRRVQHSRRGSFVVSGRPPRREQAVP